jgi:protein SCO1/2
MGHSMKISVGDSVTAEATRRSLLLASAAAAGTVVAATAVRPRPVVKTGMTAEPKVMTAGARYSDQLPDVACMTQSGRVVRLVSDLIRDRITLVSFMYTQCNGICPATSGLFHKLRAPLAAEFGDRVCLVSVTLDPLTDTPQRLRQYARNFQAESELSPPQGLASWTFLTGGAEVVESIRRGFGYVDPDPVRDQDRSQHAALFTFGNDSTNRWCTFPAGLPFEQALAGVIRVCGSSSHQRYGRLPVPEA